MRTIALGGLPANRGEAGRPESVCGCDPGLRRDDGDRPHHPTGADGLRNRYRPELILRKARAGNGSAAPVELVDIPGILRAHELIEAKELAVLRLLAGWLHQLRVAFGLPAASPGGLWAALLSGQRAGRYSLVSGTGRTGGDRAAFRLNELYRHFAALGALDQLALVLRTAEGLGWPGDARALTELRTGLGIIIDLQRRGRRAQIEAHPAG